MGVGIYRGDRKERRDSVRCFSTPFSLCVFRDLGGDLKTRPKIESTYLTMRFVPHHVV